MGITTHIAHPVDKRALCEDHRRGHEMSDDPRGTRCAKCRTYLRHHPQIAAMIARVLGVRVGDLTLGAGPTELEARAKKCKTQEGAARNIRQANALRELARVMGGDA